MKSNYVAIRLAVAFSLLIGILVGTGWLGLSRMAGMNARIHEVTDQHYEKARLCREALQYSSRNSRITMQVLLLQDQKNLEALLDERMANTEKISALARLISNRVTESEERQLLNRIQEARKPYIESYQQALHLFLDEHKEEEARQLMVYTTLPLIRDYHDAWDAFAEYQGRQMESARNHAEASYFTASKQLLGLLCIGTALATIIGILVTRSLVREITVRQEAEVLRRSKDELETRVQKRTAELSRANEEARSAAARLSATLEELQTSEQRLRALANSAPIGIYLTDAWGRMLYVNPCLQKIIDLPMEECLNDAWIRLIHPEDVTRVTAGGDDAVQQGGEFDQEFRFLKPDGQTRWVHFRSVGIRSEAGKVINRVGTVEDITERKQAEIALEKAQAELVAASRQAGMAEMATGVLHNVNNVLNSIDVSMSLLRERMQNSKCANLGRVTALLREHEQDLGNFLTEDPRGKQVPVYLEALANHIPQEQGFILKELESFTKNVAHIKEIVALQQNCARISNNPESFNLPDLLEDAVRINASALARHSVEIVREYEPHLTEITAEKHKVLQILVNLIRNARQACTASDQKERRLAIGTSNGGDFVRISVADNGVGIPPENLERIFNHGFTTKKDGHGFGLHSSSVAAKEMGGELRVTSPGPGQGATFTLELPLRTPLQMAA